MAIESNRDPTANNETLWTQDIWAKDGTTRIVVGQIKAISDAAATPGAVASRFEFWTMNSSGTLTKALTIDSTQAAAFTSLVRWGGIETGITAGVGGTQANAVALSSTKTVHNITTVTSANDSVKLPASTGAGAVHFVKNSAAANSAQLFGAGTDTIDGVAAATGVAVAAGKSRICVDFAAGTWLSILGA